MSIEWFRDLSIVILGFMTLAMLIVAAILTFRLYRKVKSVVLLIKAISKTIHDTVLLIKRGIKPVLPVLSLIQGIGRGFKGIRKIFIKKKNKEEKVMNGDNAKGLAIGLLTGAVIGGVCALLYAPKSGKQTRELIIGKASEFIDEVVDTVKDETGGIIGSVKGVASEASRKGQVVAQAIRNREPSGSSSGSSFGSSSGS